MALVLPSQLFVGSEGSLSLWASVLCDVSLGASWQPPQTGLYPFSFPHWLLS